MRLSAEERMMYEVMKAVYDSGIPVDFKGAMVMKACLMEAGFSEDTRHTVDIDANWYSDTPPTAEQMENSFAEALRKNGINLTIQLYRMYGEGRSAGFVIKNPENDETLFRMDMDVNRPVQPTQIYDVAGLRFRGISPRQMMADKISVISSDKVFRRIKDVVDIYYLSQVFELNPAVLRQTLKDSGRTLQSFDGFLNRSDDLRHAYEKFRFTGDVSKPSFDEVYNAVKTYINDLIPQEKHKSP